MVNDAEVKMPNAKMADVLDNFSNSITDHELFGYTESNISSMRSEIYNVMAHTMNSYKNHRIHEPSSGSVHDLVSDSEEDEEEVEILVSQDLEDTDVVMSDAEFTEDASYQFQSDEDDDLSIDTKGKCSVSKPKY